MALPDASPLLSLPPDSWRALATRLRAAGLGTDAVTRVNALARPNIDAIRMTVLRWHLRREATVQAQAMRLFLYRDAVTEAEARAILGDALDLARAVEIGLLAVRDDGRVRARYMLALVDRLYLLHDDLRDGDDAVMGLGHTTTALCRAAYPAKRVGRVLDVGCGAGAAALLCAPSADEVLGIDINPRAVTLARVNALLNGIPNADFRVGDLFAPAAGESFDLIVSQPPFVARAETETDTPATHGGSRGDELSRRLFRELPPYLAPGGRAVILVEWPVVDDAPLANRVREALASPELSVLLLESPSPSLDEHCSAYAVTELQRLDEDFEARFTVLRDHLEASGVKALRLALNVVQRGEASKGWTSALPVLPLGEIALTSSHIDQLIAVRNLTSGPEPNFLAARLRIPAGTKLSEERPPGGQPRLVVTFGEGAIVSPVRLNRAVYEVLTVANEAESVRHAMEVIATKHGAPMSAVEREVGKMLRHALEHGLLDIA